jgi:RNA polymerase sigma-70 factor (ECF subfamily)
LSQFVEALYRQYAADLTVALALSMNDREAAADLVHEVFVCAIVEEGKLREHTDQRGWLFRTGYNMARNQRKLLLRRRYSIERQLGVLPADAWDQAIDLRRSLSKLSRRQRDAVVLHHYFGFGVGETSVLLGCAEGTVMTHLHRARKALEQSLDAKEAT